MISLPMIEAVASGQQIASREDNPTTYVCVIGIWVSQFEMSHPRKFSLFCLGTTDYMICQPELIWYDTTCLFAWVL